MEQNNTPRPEEGSTPERETVAHLQMPTNNSPAAPSPQPEPGETTPARETMRLPKHSASAEQDLWNTSAAAEPAMPKPVASEPAVTPTEPVVTPAEPVVTPAEPALPEPVTEPVAAPVEPTLPATETMPKAEQAPVEEQRPATEPMPEMAAPMPESVPAEEPTPTAMPAEEPTNFQPIYAPASTVAPKPKKKRPGWFAVFAGMTAAALAGGAIGFTATQYYNPGGVRPSSMTAHEETKGTTKPVNSTVGAADWEAVAKEVGDTVVSLDVSTDNGQAQGSGVIISKDGHILTNNHVVAGANEIFVRFSDGRVFEGQVMGTDEATDLAVVKIKDAPKDIAVAQLGDSSTVKVGQAVAAIGNPMGLNSTLTTGVVSALDRPTQADRAGAVTNAIQIDAAINPGNSGGPVFDQQGKVIGIASSIITVKTGFNGQSAGSIGLGFAIPVNLAKNISKQLVEKGSAEHAYLGVSISNGLAKFDETRRTAAVVKTVEPETPAAKAGIKEGDNIVEIDGKKVSTATALTGFVRQYRAGDVITVKFERGGKLMETNVTLATRPDPR